MRPAYPDSRDTCATFKANGKRFASLRTRLIRLILPSACYQNPLMQGQTLNKGCLVATGAFGRTNSAIGWWSAWLAVLLLASPPVFGQVSVFDPSFQIGPGANDAVNALVVQQDGRILVGGDFTSIGGLSNSYFARLNADGAVDTSFVQGGATDGSVNCLLQQPDRKVLVGGGFNRLLGVERRGLARLLEDGSVDADFNAGNVLATNESAFSFGLQDDGRILIGLSEGDWVSRIVRVDTNGALDATFYCTNQFPGYLFAITPLDDGSILVGGNVYGVDGLPRYGLFRLQPDGRLDDTFNPGLEQYSSVFTMVKQASGHFLVGGLLNRTGASNAVPLLRLTPDLQWDESFKTDRFVGGATPYGNSWITALLLQPDGEIVAGGSFFEVGGYWRRQIVRLTPDGHVDGCFDPGLGLGGAEPAGPVRRLALQADGRILVGGKFQGVDGHDQPLNLARLLSESDCDRMRVYFLSGAWGSFDTFAAATFPPGGTNSLEWSENLSDWQTLETNTSPYIYYYFPMTSAPQAFFRARKEF